MTTKKVTMQKIKDVLRLKFQAKLSVHQIALSLCLSLGVISKYLQRAEAAGIGWPLPEGMEGEAPARPAGHGGPNSGGA